MVSAKKYYEAGQKTNRFSKVLHSMGLTWEEVADIYHEEAVFIAAERTL